MKKTLFLICFSVILVSCRKNAVKSNADYQGKWSQAKSDTKNCGPYVLEISGSDNGNYYSKSLEHECSKANKHSGKVKKDSKTLKIGYFFKLKLDQGPTPIDSVFVETGAGMYYSKMTMVLDGNTFYKAP